MLSAGCHAALGAQVETSSLTQSTKRYDTICDCKSCLQEQRSAQRHCIHSGRGDPTPWQGQLQLLQISQA